jgi:uncharacterized small protein (DUF1192 family)
MKNKKHIIFGALLMVILISISIIVAGVDLSLFNNEEKTDISELSNETKEEILEWVFNYPLRTYLDLTTNKTEIGAIEEEIQLLYPERVRVINVINPETGEKETEVIVDTPTEQELVLAIQEIYKRIVQLEQENTLLKSELCKKVNTYSWCE